MDIWTEKSEVKPKEVAEPKKELKFKTLAEAEEKRGLKILSYGEFSTGKTHFGLSSKSPIYIIDTENGASPLANKFPDAKVMNICNNVGKDDDEKDEVINFEQFQEVVNHLINIPDEEIGTIIIDSISDIWAWAQAYAKTKIFKIPIEKRFQQQWDWAVPTKLYLNQLIKLINKNVNIIFIARASEEYSGPGSPSGTFKPQCQKRTPYWVDIVLHHKIKFINKQINFYAKIEKCRQNGNIIGEFIDNPTLEKIEKMIKDERK